jgi:rSAM-associated Gly-rich repeat protein
MDKLTRRTLLRALAGSALSTAGTVVLARAALADASEATTEESTLASHDVQERAASLAEGGVDLDEASSARFRNAVFPKGGGGGFRNGGFRKGGFLNGGGGGGFRNSVFRNS